MLLESGGNANNLSKRQNMTGNMPLTIIEKYFVMFSSACKAKIKSISEQGNI